MDSLGKMLSLLFSRFEDFLGLLSPVVLSRWKIAYLSAFFVLLSTFESMESSKDDLAFYFWNFS